MCEEWEREYKESTEYIDTKQSGGWLYNDESTQCMGHNCTGSKPICHDGRMNGAWYIIHFIQSKGHHYYKIANSPWR